MLSDEMGLLIIAIGLLMIGAAFAVWSIVGRIKRIEVILERHRIR